LSALKKIVSVRRAQTVTAVRRHVESTINASRRTIANFAKYSTP
jgi:hypothetical protein